jgi:hypothetical protein
MRQKTSEARQDTQRARGNARATLAMRRYDRTLTEITEITEIQWRVALRESCAAGSKA